jgi:uncharacterized protein (DUF488 family)
MASGSYVAQLTTITASQHPREQYDIERNMASQHRPLLLTLGYGKRSIDITISLLKQHDVAFLADVRSIPKSRYHPDFSQDALKEHLRTHGISYLFFGEELGGRPDDPTCYDETGRVDYDACRQRPAFRAGISRLCDAWEQGRRVALLCSESRPQDCHRSKLVGLALSEAGVEVTHVDEVGALVTQQEVMERLHEGQLQLFTDLATGKSVRSRHRYRPGRV